MDIRRPQKDQANSDAESIRSIILGWFALKLTALITTKFALHKKFQLQKVRQFLQIQQHAISMTSGHRLLYL